MNKITIDIPKTLPVFGQISIVTSTGEFVGHLVREKGIRSKIIIDPSSPYEAKELLCADIAQVEYKITRRTPAEHQAEK